MFWVSQLVQLVCMTYCYHWFSFAQDLIDQDSVFTKLKIQKYLWDKYQEQESEEEPTPEDQVVDLNELD